MCILSLKACTAPPANKRSDNIQNKVTHVLQLRTQTQTQTTEAKAAPAKRIQTAERRKKKDTNFDVLEQVIQTSRLLPTVQLFDAVWHRAFKWLGSKSRPTVQYLQKKYFQLVSPETLQKQYLCNSGSWDAGKLGFAGFWVGIIGTYPGSGSGSQSMESFHSSWQRRVQRDARASPLQKFAVMQELFKAELREKFQWGSQQEFMTWPDRQAQTLRTTQRSPAVDFWKHREPKITGLQNHVHVSLRTGPADSADPATLTQFWVMASLKQKQVSPAEMSIDPKFARLLCQAIAAEGQPLVASLVDLGVFKGERREDLDVSVLRRCFLEHAVVMQGHLPNSSWPRQCRRLGEPVDAFLCTRLNFALHADCEHSAFVKALTGDPKVDLRSLPEQRRRGRKRKHGSTNGT